MNSHSISCLLFMLMPTRTALGEEIEFQADRKKPRYHSD